MNLKKIKDSTKEILEAENWWDRTNTWEKLIILKDKKLTELSLHSLKEETIEELKRKHSPDSANAVKWWNNLIKDRPLYALELASGVGARVTAIPTQDKQTILRLHKINKK